MFKTFRSYRLAVEFYRRCQEVRAPAFLKNQLLRAACASVETSNVDEIAKEVALRALAPIFEKALLAEAPIAPSSRSVYPTVPSLSGKSFNPTKDFNNPIRISGGILKLLPGDYVVPVMTY